MFERRSVFKFVLPLMSFSFYNMRMVEYRDARRITS